jgi:hypothetical protein
MVERVENLLDKLDRLVETICGVTQDEFYQDVYLDQGDLEW